MSSLGRVGIRWYIMYHLMLCLDDSLVPDDRGMTDTDSFGDSPVRHPFAGQQFDDPAAVAAGPEALKKRVQQATDIALRPWAS